MTAPADLISPSQVDSIARPARLPSIGGTGPGGGSAPSGEILSSIDAHLGPLIPYLNLAVASRQPVVVLQMWRRNQYASLLPFHLHLRWTNSVAQLPLTANFGLVPFFGSDELYANTPLYAVCDSIRAREGARGERCKNRSERPNDFYIPDWEQGCNRRRDELEGLVLHGGAFLGVDVLSAEGRIARGSRTLGRFAVRNALRPYLLVPAKGGVSEASGRAFAEVDLLIVNIQGLRGRRTIESIQQAIRGRGMDRPALIVASSPSDLIALGLGDLLERVCVRALGAPAQIDEVRVAGVAQDRDLAERSFNFAVEELRGSLKDDYLLDLAKSAWWATRQSVDGERPEPEMQRFMSALERLSQDDPDTARLLSYGKDVLCDAAGDVELARNRRQAVTNIALHANGRAGTLIIARGCGVARLRGELAGLMGESAEALHELGLRIQSHFSPPPAGETDVAIVAGYYGLATIDAILMSRATKIHLILDPVEARAAWYGVQRIIGCLKQVGVSEPLTTLEALAEGIAEGIPAHLRARVTDVSLPQTRFDLFPESDGAGVGARKLLRPDDEEVTIYLTEGTRLDVRVNARFDVLAPVGGRLRTVSAQALKPGDEIVLLQEDARALFSEQLMRALDEGVLKNAAAERAMWLLIVKAVNEAQRPNLRAVTGRMAELGHPVNYATVRAWVTFSDDSMPCTPHQRARFLAFAEAFGISLPEIELVKKFQAIKRWRIGHRAAGRHLVRAIRAAYLNRLDAVSQERLRREWGVDAFELVQSARVAVVDEVVLPGGTEDAVD